MCDPNNKSDGNRVSETCLPAWGWDWFFPAAAGPPGTQSIPTSPGLRAPSEALGPATAAATANQAQASFQWSLDVVVASPLNKDYSQSPPVVRVGEQLCITGLNSWAAAFISAKRSQASQA